MVLNPAELAELTARTPLRGARLSDARPVEPRAARLSDAHPPLPAGGTPNVVTERMAIERFLARWREFQHLIPPGVKAFLYEPVRDMREAVGQ